MQGWGTLALAQAGITWNILYTFGNRPMVLSLLLILMTGALLVVTGMWLTVQFRFIQMQYPAVVLAFERQVLTASLPVAAVMHAIGIAAVTELGDVPYYLCAVVCLLYHLLARPLESSFHQTKAARAIGGAAATPSEAIVQVGLQVMQLLCHTAMPCRSCCLPELLFAACSNVTLKKCSGVLPVVNGACACANSARVHVLFQAA